MILILNPKLVTSRGLFEVDNIYNDDDILRLRMLLDLFDLVIFFSKNKIVKLLLDLRADQDGNSLDGCCKLLHFNIGVLEHMVRIIKFSTLFNIYWEQVQIQIHAKSL